jgi:hypothetical protein
MRQPRRFAVVIPCSVLLLVSVLLIHTRCASDDNSVTPNNPLPAITTIDPAYIEVRNSSLNVTVHGTGFGIESVVRWNGADRHTSIVNLTQGETALQALLTTSDVDTPTVGHITVFNGPPGGGTSNTVNFAVYAQGQTNPVPVLNSVLPNNVSSSGGDVTLTLAGTDFVGASVVLWTPALASTALSETPTAVSSTEITVVIPAADIGPSGTAHVQVLNPAPGGGTSSTLNVSVL